MPERAKILLVDDREENLIALEAILSSLDLMPIRAKSGEEALKALLGTEFALILLDVRMPGMDGFETAAHIKRRERTRNIPIIFLTVVDSAPDYAFRSYAAGAVDYLTKPFDPWVLRAKVAVFVELYNMNRRLAEQATMLRERLNTELPPGDAAEHAAVLPELSKRLTAVEDELTRVVELARKGGDSSLTGSLSDLSNRLKHLRAGFDALT
ncbi:response regulator [Streptosporangium subroseum]|jgi:CheY-like chemotaxis protein|uniref:Response regulator receiver domain-containing protein n=1 Tax=Streptosporangium subroseum TaxID=106412 RepID=A0A239MBS0_9ACTN|nr:MULTISPECIES: response regulator [Streptosporangium]AWS48019.1 response regulator [Streptosporangium sp. 'caverna']WSA16901.1 response regulator [Streptosporangium subroseum]SNT40457.1 Response regulator receiver domain-containing protein [Streptosporangium subroseum]